MSDDRGCVGGTSRFCNDWILWIIIILIILCVFPNIFGGFTGKC